jgi:hypothetical protein
MVKEQLRDARPLKECKQVLFSDIDASKYQTFQSWGVVDFSYALEQSFGILLLPASLATILVQFKIIELRDKPQ